MPIVLVVKRIQADLLVLHLWCLSVKVITVTNPFLLKLPQAHIFAILFRVF